MAVEPEEGIVDVGPQAGQPAIYAAMGAIQKAFAADGIGKNRKNEQQEYKFRGIDEVYNRLSPLLAENDLFLVPRVLGHKRTEHATRSGGTMFMVALDVEIDFVSTRDGSRVTVKTYGEAMDSGDKACNKAMSAALKYAVIMVFAIPVPADATTDADFTTQEEVVPSGPSYSEWLKNLELAVKYDELVEAVKNGPEGFRNRLKKDKTTWVALKSRVETAEKNASAS